MLLACNETASRIRLAYLCIFMYLHAWVVRCTSGEQIVERCKCLYRHVRTHISRPRSHALPLYLRISRRVQGLRKSLVFDEMSSRGDEKEA